MARTQLRQASNQRDVSAAIAALLGMVLVVIQAQSSSEYAPIGFVTLAFMAAAVGFGLLGHWHMREAAVGINLDASRRWVSLDGVHPNSQQQSTMPPAHTDMRRHLRNVRG